MKILSLFDGISCGRLALERAGIPVEKYYASEIDKYAIQVAQKNYPDTIQIGDVNSINWSNYGDSVDMVIGGSPCQDLSIAKQNREGLRGARSGLFWKYVEALEVIHPKWFLLENVASMRNEDRDAITATLKRIYPETECIMINSALLSAQQRKRYYWTNWHVEQPQDKGILLKDILESGQVIRGNKSHAVISSAGRTTEREYFKKNQGDLKAYYLDANYYKGGSLEHNLEKHNREIVAEPVTQRSMSNLRMPDEKSKTLLSSMWKGSQSNGMTNVPERIGELAGCGTGQASRIYSVRGKSVCLNANGGGGGAKTGLYKVDLPDGMELQEFADAGYWRDKDGQLHIWLSKDINPWRTIPHECVHIANRILAERDVVYFPTQDEALAYLVGFLCKNVAKAYNELYKTDEQAEQKD